MALQTWVFVLFLRPNFEVDYDFKNSRVTRSFISSREMDKFATQGALIGFSGFFVHSCSDPMYTATLV